MADSISATITGTSATLSGFDTLSTQMEAELQALIEKHTNGTFDDSQAVVPVLTGELQGSGHADIGHLQGTVTYDAEYALWVDQGHHTRSGSFVPPNPFLSLPFQQHAQQFEDDAKNL